MINQEPIFTGLGTVKTVLFWEIYPSSYRNEDIKDKYYGYYYTLDRSGNTDEVGTTDDYSSISEVIADMKETFKDKYTVLEIDKVF